MSTCCDVTPDRSTATADLTVALAGNPNSGKTTIFNALTGLRQKVANYPGVTVEKKTGRCKLPDGRKANIIDLPGTYSLISRSPDEVVAMEVLRGLRADTPAPDAVIVVVDASNLQRNLYLVSQLIELGRPLVVALNMMDVAERRGLHVDPEALAKVLDVPVIPVIGHKRVGIEQLKQAVAKARPARMPDWPLPQAMKDELVVVGGALAILDITGSDEGEDVGTKARRHEGTKGGQGMEGASGEQLDPQSRIENRKSKIPFPHPQSKIRNPQSHLVSPTDPRRLERYQALAERLLIGDYAEDLAEYTRHEPVASLLRSAEQRLGSLGIDPMQADIEAHYRWIENVAGDSQATLEELAAMGAQAPADVLEYESPRRRAFSDRIDAVLVHKVWGLVIFALIMGTLFVTLFWAAKPIMESLTEGVKWLGEVVTTHMPEGPLHDLVADGIFAGVGAVVVFVPQIALLFLFLAILEDSGYLARAAFLMDRLLAKVGLHGKSFIPLLSSFACAIPGIMATRTIENRKDRLATILIAPFMSCSARLPVYALLIGMFFSRWGSLAQAGIMLGLYAAGIIAAVCIAWIFKRTLLKGAPSAFILEMPSYKLPQVSQVGRQVFTNTRAFLTKAGTTIFCLSVVLWAMTYYPRLPESQKEQVVATVKSQPEATEKAVDKAVAAAQLEHSIAGRFGHAIEPALRPLGYDWKIGVGLVGAFAAREVFVSTMGIIYSVGEVKDETADLAVAMRADVRPNGSPVWTPLIGVSLLIWFVLAMQCISTIAIVRRETNSWRWPLFMLVYMNGLAYVVCLGLYQVGRLVL